MRVVRLTSWAAGAIVVAGLAAYANSFSGPFVYDDLAAIVDNPTIRQLGHLGAILTPPGDRAGTVGGRPLVNLSLAVNHAVGGVQVEGYHAVNLAIHLLAALTLFGLVRQTWVRRAGPAALIEEMPLPATCLGLAVALVWLLHPLQTESVTYVVQRAESLMGLFYLLTLYCFVRSAEPAAAAPGYRALFASFWEAGAVTCCFAGMATKEVMVTAPVVVLLYDRTFIAGTFRAAWRRRRPLYLGLAASWILLAVLVAGTHGRGGSASLGAGDTFRYLLTQAAAIARYLRLVVWPHPLVFDYGPTLVSHLGEVWPQLLLVIALAAATVWALARRPVAGFFGAAFFLILAPSSSLVPIVTEPVAEHRMYLPLAVLAALALLSLHAGLERRRRRRSPHPSSESAIVTLAVAVVLAVALGLATARRNQDYRTALALWQSVVAERPGNVRARNNLGSALLAEGSAAAATREFSEALRLEPDYVPAHYNLGMLLLDSGYPREAVPHLERALAGPLHVTEARLALADALAQSDRLAESLEQYRAVARLEPDNLKANFGLGNALAAQGRYAEAIPVLRQAVALDPNQVVTRNNLGNALMFAGQTEAAISQYREALNLSPGNAEVEKNLDQALALQQARARP